MKRSSTLTVLFSVVLMLGIIAHVNIASANPQDSSARFGKRYASLATESAPSVTPQGGAGSGWRADVSVAGSMYAEITPSMGTYVDPVSGAVTLYVAYSWYNSAAGKYDGRLDRSFDGGVTWSKWYDFWWNVNNIVNPSLAVAYNNTVFVADEFYSTAGGDSNIEIWRFPGGQGFDVDVDAWDDRHPELTIEYGYGSINYMHISYEMYWGYDDRDLYYARSTNWGQTWTTTVLRGGNATPEVDDVFTESDIAYSQGSLYIAYRHSTDYLTPGHIEVMYSTNFGASFLGPVDVTGTKNLDAWAPSIAGSRVGLWFKPTTLWVAFRNDSGAPTYGDIFACWSHDYGDTWSTPQTIAASTNHEDKPQLTVDGMGTESTNLPGRFHLVYWTSESPAPRYNGIYYTQIADFEPSYFPAPSVYYFYEGWSTPQGQIIDNNGWAAAGYPAPTITTFTRMIGAEKIWVPGVAWTDFRNPTYDIYFTTLDTMFTVSYFPSTQTVVAGGSLSYRVTVTLNSGATATATLDITGPLTYHAASAHIWGHTFSPATLAPTGTSLLTFNTANYIAPGAYSFGVSAVIGGYRRTATVPFTVVAAPTLTLNLSPSTVPRGTKLTLSGQLTPGMATTINIYYRLPHATGSWALATPIPTNAAGAYSVSATVPMSLPAGVYDLIAVWFNPANGKYAASPIRVVTFT